VDVTGIPKDVEGAYVIPTAGQLEGADGRKFTTILDCFGKLHRFEVKGSTGQVCITAQMMQTGFRNVSQQGE
jgi:hypothetical protein